MELNGKTLLITGIGGFIGLRTAELALARGMTVKGLQRSQPKADLARQLGADVIVGCVTDPDAAKAACEGADIVLHTAAIVREGGSLEEFHQVNVDGAVTVAKAARQAGAKTFVHLSSVMVYGFDFPDGVTESGPLRGENNPYCQTKIDSEKAVLALNNPPDYGVTVIRPGDVYGPGSTYWVVKPLELMTKGLFILANNGKGVMNHVYIDNLIEGIFLAIENEAYGEIFNLTDGQSTTWKEYFTQLAKLKNISQPVALPGPLLKLLIRLRSFAQTVVGKSPDVFPDSVDFISRPHTYSIEKAKKQLGYIPKVSFQEGMSRTQVWLNQLH
ncbi:NAD-dependent epimerase/dehydratase family protein [Oscillatoria sp. CS-180]|uniref:NAD-dependent epimerase/dehydratase family protein n=1 Tax=Oscillatoria sp. CS-180 TaxID=3021720 RepID=UPI00232FE326|nr:NAD-dependent epimerase/dehydratase family protein [Oscillatoria sp. CS-180]MDB9526160.1 NAD-dependent epimerase/dehydratase family protein [Oscillatoria sp. CS-180]